MKTKTLFCKRLVISIFVSFLFINSYAQSVDSVAVKTAALDYIEGWYSGDTARISKALSPDLIKRGFIISHKDNQLIKAEASYAQMVEWTGKKPNELLKQPDLKFEVTIIELGRNIAMVKVVSPQYIDYLHMGKMDNEWKIYNVIWEPNIIK